MKHVGESLALVLTTALSLAAITSAWAQDPGPSGPPVAIPDGAVLATPAEVALMGGSKADIDHQRGVWASIPTHVALEQRTLGAAERALAAPAFANIGQPGGLAPMIAPQTCGGAMYFSYYKIVSDTQTEQCFAGSAGTYTLTTKFVDYGGTANIRLQAAGFKGRTYYSIWNTYFWSTTRGPGDYTWWPFEVTGWDHVLTVHRVQLY